MAQAWFHYLKDYPGNLSYYLYGIILYGCSIGSESEVRNRACSNHLTARLQPHLIEEQLIKDLASSRVSIAESPSNIVQSPLGVVPKGDGSPRRIHDLSYPKKQSTNDSIPEAYGYLTFSTITNVLAGIL